MTTIMRRARGSGLLVAGRIILATLLVLLPFAGAEAASTCRKDAHASAACAPAGQWAFSGARKRNTVRLQSDCPCQVIVRSFRSRVTYECPCLTR